MAQEKVMGEILEALSARRNSATLVLPVRIAAAAVAS